MSSVARHFVDSIRYSAANATPFEFVYTQNVFPWAYYWDLLGRLPKDDAYEDARYENRIIAKVEKLEDPFWKELSAWMLSHEVFDVITAKFAKTLRERFPGYTHAARELRLVRDSGGYNIQPHTDIADKAVSLLFYLPTGRGILDIPNRKGMAKFGTSVYTPKAKDFRSDGSARYPFEDFDKQYTAPFLPNSLFGFARSDSSFHGVEPIGAVVRDVLLYNIYMKAA